MSPPISFILRWTDSDRTKIVTLSASSCHTRTVIYLHGGWVPIFIFNLIIVIVTVHSAGFVACATEVMLP